MPIIVCSEGSDLVVNCVKAAVSSSGWPQGDVRATSTNLKELLTLFLTLARPPESESGSGFKSMPVSDIASDNMLIISSDSGARHSGLPGDAREPEVCGLLGAELTIADVWEVVLMGGFHAGNKADDRRSAFSTFNTLPFFLNNSD